MHFWMRRVAKLWSVLRLERKQTVCRPLTGPLAVHPRLGSRLEEEECGRFVDTWRRFGARGDGFQAPPCTTHGEPYSEP